MIHIKKCKKCKRLFDISTNFETCPKCRRKENNIMGMKGDKI